MTAGGPAFAQLNVRRSADSQIGPEETSMGQARKPAAGRGAPIGLGLIGLGTMGQVHADALTAPDQVDLALRAAADPRPGAAYGQIPVVGDYRALLERPDIAAISIATPPSTHYPLAVAALDAGRHVLVEKPPTLTVEESRALIELASRRQRVLFMAFHARYHRAVEVARRELARREVRTVDIAFREYALNFHDPHGWIFDPEAAGGGVLMDSGINALSVLAWVLPNSELRPTHARLSYDPAYRVEMAAEVDFSLGGRGAGRMEMDWLHRGPEVRTIGFGAGADSYVIDISRGQLVKNGAPVVDGDPLPEYRLLYRDFAAHLARGASSYSTTELEFIHETYRIAARV